jgi:hypothetical protein
VGRAARVDDLDLGAEGAETPDAVIALCVAVVTGEES